MAAAMPLLVADASTDHTSPEASTMEMATAWHWPAFSGWEPASPDDEYDPKRATTPVNNWAGCVDGSAG
jgi:hypothetical protein